MGVAQPVAASAPSGTAAPERIGRPHLLLAGLTVPFVVAAAAVFAGPLPALALVAFPVLTIALSRSPRDVVTVLTTLVVLLFFVPARLVFGPLGGFATPAAIVGLYAGWRWISRGLTPAVEPAPGRQPLRVAALAFLAAHLVSFVAASVRPTDLFETNAADRGLVVIVSGVCVLLLAVDGIATRRRLEVLLRRIAIAGTALAGIGIVQFATGLDVAARIQIPGLQNQFGDESFIHERSGFRRVAGTSEHPIEFSVVLAMVFPLALHYALTAPAGRRRWWWAAVVAIGIALPMSVSRTAVLGIAAVAVTLVPTWPRARRRQAFKLLLVYAVAMKLLVPGLLGTIRALFFSVGVDPSISARQGDYGYVGRFISENPIFGRGYATFIPTRYDFIDNQYMLSLVETGVLGLLSLVVLLVVAMSLARGARRRSADPETRDLGQALAASLAVVAVSCATFDFLSFPTARTLFFVLAGCAGALWRMQARPDPSAPPHDDVPVSVTVTER